MSIDTPGFRGQCCSLDCCKSGGLSSECDIFFNKRLLGGHLVVMVWLNDRLPGISHP